MVLLSEKSSGYETQKVAFNILKQITEICDKQHLRYYLFYGTLIGAVRHHGYIPWDDDTDIMMPRPDYEKLLEYLRSFPEKIAPLEVFNPNTCDDYPYMITRISDPAYRIIMKNERSFGLGIFIDIYPFDGLGNEEKEVDRYARKGDLLSSLCYQATREHFAVETTVSPLRKVLKLPTFLIAKAIGKNFFQKRLQKLANQYSYDSSKYVGCIVWLSGGKKDIFERSWLEGPKTVLFENAQFKIPEQYDTILSHIYGDYMTLPPEAERSGHHYYDVYKVTQDDSEN